MKIIVKTCMLLSALLIASSYAAWPSALFDVIPPDGYSLEESELDIGYSYTFYNPEDREMGLGILVRTLKGDETLETALKDIIGVDNLPGNNGDMGSMDVKKNSDLKGKIEVESDRLVPKIINLSDFEPKEAQRYGCEKGKYVTFDYLNLGVKYEMMFLQKKAKLYAVGFSLPVDKWADNAAILRNAMLTFRVR